MQPTRALQGKEENDQQQPFSWRRRLIFAAVGVPVLIITITLLLTRKTRFLDTLGVVRSHADCTSDPCGEYSLRLQRTMNISIDPCADFHGYVCDGWTKLHADSVFSMTCAQVIDDVGRHSRTMSVPLRNQTPAQKAAGFYTTCLSVYTENRNEVDEMKMILHQAGIYWPHINPISIDVLRTVVYMAHRWHWGNIFSVTWNGPSLHLGVSDGFEQLVQMRSELVRTKAYQAYFQTLWNAYAEGTNKPAVTYQQQVSIEDAILPALMKVLNSSDTDHVTIDISDLNHLVPTIPLETWKNIFKEEFSMAQNFSGTNELLRVGSGHGLFAADLELDLLRSASAAGGSGQQAAQRYEPEHT
ncbi:hypothetical protein HPB47_015076 [Ixodes persulcatus]|uniref:Uncharacterized protein n=1 Tax=Ixodes persulcatus TaxID=34615 RepID=A0AC60QUF0_IXOPE|nr:hypothetical protein HPB47_015076 [Ixodes persulcatus]